jgi:sterol desaturase/sphingolipid hydroxylase (fatty acid hydroxylase superfamily)
MGHEVAVLWAAHVVHHQSQDYNLSTALRQTSSGALLRLGVLPAHGHWLACRRWCSASSR